MEAAGAEERVAEIEQQAARYRWIRERCDAYADLRLVLITKGHIMSHDKSVIVPSLDEVIDAEIARDGPAS